MKRSTLLFVVCVALFIVGVFFLKQQVGHRYDWNPSFSPSDRNPFGTALFDSLMKETLPEGYRVENTAMEDYIAHHGSATHQQVMLVEEINYFYSHEVDSLLRFVARGNTVVLAYCCPTEFCDTLNYQLRFESGIFNISDIQKYFRNEDTPLYDTLVYDGTGAYPERAFRVYHSLVSQSIYNTDPSTTEPVISMVKADSLKSEYAVATKTYLGEGKLYIVTMPYLFSNYSVMDDDCRGLMLRLMNELAERPVVRVHKMSNEEELVDKGFTPLSFMRRHPPLLFAWRLLLIGAVLLLVVNSRRRRRAIPLRLEEPNTTVSFLRQLSRLYRKRSDHSPLIHKRYRTFADHMMRRYRLDVQDKERAVRSHVVQTVATLTGRSRHDVEYDFDELDRLHETIPPVPLALFAHAVKIIERLTPGQEM